VRNQALFRIFISRVSLIEYCDIFLLTLFCFIHLRRILSSSREGLTVRQRFTRPCLTLWVEMTPMLSWRRQRPGSTLCSTLRHPQGTMCSLALWKTLRGKRSKVLQNRSKFSCQYKNLGDKACVPNNLHYHSKEYGHYDFFLFTGNTFQ